MNKKLVSLLCALLFISLAGCERIQVSGLKTIPKEIPTNSSVNTAWCGFMCEANGFIYYVSGAGNKESIIRMGEDGSNPTTVTTGEYNYLHELTSDGAYLYFVSSDGPIEMNLGKIDTIYRLPLGGGAEQKVTQGYVFHLQSVKGKLYWDDSSNKIMCVNADGSDLQTLLSIPADSAADGIDYLVAGESIYYTTGTWADSSLRDNIFRINMDGKNAVQLNSGKLDAVCALFFDRGKLYFLTEPFNGDTAACSSLETLDEQGAAIKLVDKVGYYTQDYHENEFCGISDNTFYYFAFQDANHNLDHVYMNLHRFDLAAKRDTVMLRHIDMGFSAIGTLASARGKSIRNDGVTGLYILGNDIYFSPDNWNKNP